MRERDEYACRWPQFDLRIEIQGAHLEAPTDAQVTVLAARAAQPDAVLPPVEAHYVMWLLGRTSDEIERQRTERIRSNRDLAEGSGWTLDLAVIVDDEPVGLQSVSGFDRWPDRRVVGTTSWLLASHQHQGLGTRCRAAVLELSFALLRAEAARSWALDENRGSIGVSTTLGYRHVDQHVLTEDGRQFTESVYELTAERWLNSQVRQKYAPVITGAGPLMSLLDAP